MRSFLLLLCLAYAPAAWAQNYKSMQDEGFGDVAKVLQDMTPAERAEVMKQAQQGLPEIEKMTPAQRQQLIKQLHDASDKIDYNKVDASKLDASKYKGSKQTIRDIQVGPNSR